LAIEALEKIRQRDPEWGSFSYEQMTWVLPAAGQSVFSYESIDPVFTNQPV
jgi:hypothetical protein